MLKQVNANDMVHINIRLDGIANALRCVHEAMECGSSSPDTYTSALDCIVHSLGGLSNDLAHLTGEPVREGQVVS